MNCANHPDKKAVAVYKKIGLCKECLMGFIIKADRELAKRVNHSYRRRLL